jgi:ATP-binding cassette subfamily B protein
MTTTLLSSDATTPSRDDRRDAPLTRIARLFRPHKKWVAALVGVALLQGASSVVSPFLLRGIIDRALPERSASLVSILAGGMIVAALVTAGLGVTSTWLANAVGQRVMHDLRVDVFTHLQRMSLGFFTRTQSGELQSRLANDVGGVDGVVTSTANTIVANVISALAVAAAALILDWQLALITLVIVPIFLVLSMRLARSRRRLARGRQRRLAGMTAQIEQALSISGVLLTKSMGREQTMIDRFAASSAELSRVEMDTALSGRWQGATRRAALTMIPAITYWVAGLSIAHGGSISSIGTVVAFSSMLNRLVGPATALQGIGVTVATSRGPVRPDFRGSGPAGGRPRTPRRPHAGQSGRRGEARPGLVPLRRSRRVDSARHRLRGRSRHHDRSGRTDRFGQDHPRLSDRPPLRRRFRRGLPGRVRRPGSHPRLAVRHGRPGRPGLVPLP